MTGAEWVLAAVTGVMAFLGAGVGALVSARADQRLNHWRRREETMRLLRWAADKSLDADPRVAGAGVTALASLRTAELLQPEDKRFVEELTEAVAAAQVVEYAEDAVIVMDEEDDLRG